MAPRGPGMAAFKRRAVGLQAVAQVVEEPVDTSFTDSIALVLACRGQPDCARARPAQGPHGVPTGHWIPQRLKGLEAPWGVINQGPAAPARTTEPLAGRVVGVGHAPSVACPSARTNSRLRQPSRLGNTRDPSASDRSGFYRRPSATCAFIQERCERCKLGFDGLCHCVLHTTDDNRSGLQINKLFWRASLRVVHTCSRSWYQPPVHALLTRLYGPTSARGRITFSTPTLGWHYRRSYAAVSFKRLSCATASVVHFIAAWSMLL